VRHSAGHGRKSPKRRGRDFWRAWQEEQRRLWEEENDEVWEPGCPMPPMPDMMHAWRQFFHTFMGTWPDRHWAFGGRRFRPWHQGMASYNPFVASLLSKGGGLLPLYVLHLLAQAPRYGNEIMALLTERTGGMWVANPGAIYPLMTLLEKQGLIQGRWEDPYKRTVRIYSLTEGGQMELDRLKAIVRPKLREALEVLQELASDLNRDSSEDVGE
jgi:DNA-binding PadR family transcriptional regulator